MNSNEEVKIQETIDAYLNAIKTGEEQYFRRAFYDNSAVINGNENDPEKSIMHINAFSERIKKRIKDGLKSQETPQNIDIKYIGNIANVRIDFMLEIGEKIHYGSDFINLVKRNHIWKISQKLYYVTETKKVQ
jgi:hypothetical protein